MRLVLGSRRPITTGEHRIPGLLAPLTVRRDKFGVPTIEAENDADAFFGLGFVQAQDRGFQLESLLRVVRGTMAAMVGGKALPLDRLSRRIGFRRAGELQLAAVDADIREALIAFTSGINAGQTHGSHKPPHEFELLKATPTPWEPADVLGLVKLETFLLPSNWDAELARLQILRADGPDALRDLDPAGVEAPADRGDSTAAEALASDLRLFMQFAPRGGGSNNWVIAGSRTATGKPILASDPHLGPSLPSPWYLAHLNTPTWAVAGAALAGTLVFSIAHNGFACWGVTAGLTDNTDLVLVKPDATFPTVREVISVADGADVIEEVTITPHGPVVAGDAAELIALRAVWLDPLPLRGFFDARHAKSFEQFRRPFAAWPCLPLNVVYADETGTTGYQLIGQLPKRKLGHGTLPLPAEVAGWDGLIPFDEMPFAVNPPAGFLATANDPHTADGRFGVDYVDPYRAEIIRAELATRSDWTVEFCGKLQRNQWSMPWDEIRDTVLALSATDPDATLGLDLLKKWDSHVTAESPAATVFELFVAEMATRTAKAKAPKAWRAALGGDIDLGPFSQSLFAERRVGHLVRLVQTQPDGWFADPWPAVMADALGTVVRTLRTKHGPAPAFWQWGDLRQLRLEHPIFKNHWLGRVFNAGPVPLGGDCNTVLQAAAQPLDPLDFTHNIPNLRAVFDTSNWSNSRFVLAGGQSGNPCSANFVDQFDLWLTGETIPIAWAADEVIRRSVASLRLLPAG
ncbi:penicillin acylase family protein [Limnoglobus roseus]|uniref:Penicillin acylase family protein n=1 Tax=Limnoglobus roseus TaxID=2598579 RepID=A0A5C1ADG2_9BACT|nr:penicillin acylase family protein [Limnoglobus roseus]QEL16197.1 penicillin acylase family protein [Limnoglobus roseus]